MTLTDRYVYQVIKRIPENQQKEIEKELRGLIGDMIDEKGGYSEENEEQVLKELGHPRFLADRYLDRPNHLIGSELYGTYIHLLKVLIPISAVVSFISRTTDFIMNKSDLLEYFFKSIVDMMNGAVVAFAWITIVFAVIERKCASELVNGLKRDWKPKDLPLEDKPYKPISRVGTSVGIAFTILFVILLNGYLHLFGIYYSESGTIHYVPILNEKAFHAYLPFINLAFALQIILGLVKMIYNKWTYSIAAFNLAINLLSMVLGMIIISNNNVINFNAFSFIPGMPADQAAKSVEIVRSILLFVFPLGFAADSFEGFRNAYRNRKAI